MVTSGSGSWDGIRQTFADQFEQNGTGYVYRRSQKGEAIRVSPDERRKFIDEFDENVRRARWIIFGGLTLVLGSLIGFSLLKGFDLSQAAIFGGIGLVMIPYLAYFRWAWAAPSRELGSRTPIAGARSVDEVRRLRFERMTYGQLAVAAFGGLMIPLSVSSRQDIFLGWGRLWLVFGGGLACVAAVQAFRKWQFEQDNRSGSAMPRPSNWDMITSPEASEPTPKKRYWQYLLFAVIVLGLAFVAYTPAGKQLAKQPSFFPILMIGIGCWSLITVAIGFLKGRIEPFVRGFYNTYERATQPKRFWASMAWNALFGCLCFWLALQMSEQMQSQSAEERCSGRTQPFNEALSACNEWVAQDPNDSDAYLSRGLIFLNAMKLDQAISDFSRSHALDPHSPWPLADRGISYAWKNDRDRAERDFKATRLIDPTNAVVVQGEAVLDMEAGNLESEISGLSAQLARDPTDSWSLMMRSDAYQQRGDFELARIDRERLAHLERSKASLSGH